MSEKCVNSSIKSGNKNKESKSKNINNNNQKFLDNYKVSILLSLLEKGYITKWQYDYCVKDIDS